MTLFRPARSSVVAGLIAGLSLLTAPAALATTTVARPDARASVDGSALDDQVKVTVVSNPAYDPNCVTEPCRNRDALKVEDPNGATAAGGFYCDAPTPDATPNTAYCDVQGIANVSLGAGNDTLDFSYDPAFPSFLRIELLELRGGAGDDKILGSQFGDLLISGDDGNDLIDGRGGGDHVIGGDFTSGGTGQDRIYGGPGSDRLEDGDDPASPDADTVSGGSCPDGTDGFCLATPPPDPIGPRDGPEEDTATYYRTAGAFVDLSSAAAVQGAPGEHDTLLGVESLETGDAADTIKGSAAVNHISTAGANDNVNVSGDGDNVDTVDCGNTQDAVVKDAADTTANCVSPPASNPTPIQTQLAPIQTQLAPPPPGGAGSPLVKPVLSFKKQQTLSKKHNYVVVKASCSAPCKAVKGTGKVKVGAKTIGKLKPVTKAVNGTSVPLKLKLPPKVLSKALKALTAGKKVTVPFKIAAFDGAKVLGSRSGTVKGRVKFIR